MCTQVWIVYGGSIHGGKCISSSEKKCCLRPVNMENGATAQNLSPSYSAEWVLINYTGKHKQISKWASVSGWKRNPYKFSDPLEISFLVF